MEEISVIGVDLAKNVFELCALTPSGERAWTKRLQRARFIRFMAEEAPRCLVGMEACGGAHHWARWLVGLGFSVKLMAPRTVKAYRAGAHKSDARDAAAIAEAASRAHVKAVRVKSEAAQAAQALARVRTRRLRQLVASANQLRGLIMEFGLVAPKGRSRLIETVERLEAEGALPGPIRALALDLCAESGRQSAALAQTTKTLETQVAQDPDAAVLLSIPAIGPINAAALSVALAAPADFKDGRAFAAQLGLVPRQAQSAESDRLEGIVRQRANDTRANLICAAQSLLIQVGRLKTPPRDRFLAWAQRIGARKHRNLAAVAVAAKLARIAYAVAASGNPYIARTN
jgi:transposase